MTNEIKRLDRNASGREPGTGAVRNTAAHWQALLDGLDGDGPWKRDVIAPQVVKVMRLSVAKKKTAARVTGGGKSQPLDHYEVSGTKKAHLYATRDRKVVQIEIPADRFVSKRKGWTVVKGGRGVEPPRKATEDDFPPR